jgi:diaminopimelate epimerase
MVETVAFEKWHGLGNDFVIVEHVGEPNGEDAVSQWQRRAPTWCDRHEGVGADGILVVAREGRRMWVINADGSVPEMCGNGLRCVASWLAERAGERRLAAPVQTDAGPLETEVAFVSDHEWQVRTRLGAPGFAHPETGASHLEATGLGRGHFVSMGNPHWVFLNAPGVEELRARGAELEHDTRFPARTNVEFVQPGGSGEYVVNVWERGCGLTRACGTGAAAVAAALYADGAVAPEQRVTLVLPGGRLVAERDETGSIWLTGPAVRVFAGVWSPRRS